MKQKRAFRRALTVTPVTLVKLCRHFVVALVSPAPDFDRFTLRRGLAVVRRNRNVRVINRECLLFDWVVSAADCFHHAFLSRLTMTAL